MLKIILFLCAFALIAQAFHRSSDGSKIYDLEFQGLDFNKEAESWTPVSTLVDSKIKTTSCVSGDTILGGPIWPADDKDKGWSKIYTDLPTHEAIAFQAKVYYLDQWNSNLRLTIGNDELGGLNDQLWPLIQERNLEVRRDLCGLSTPDIPPFLVFVNFTNYKQSYKSLRIDIWDANPDVRSSFGIRDVVITFHNYTLPPRNQVYPVCGVARFNLNQFADQSAMQSCPCESPLKKNETASFCTDCDQSCMFCNKKGEFGCTACEAGRYLTSEGKCANCSPNCASCSGDANICSTCKSGLYLADNTCYEECPARSTKVQIGANWYCQSPCEKDKYLDKDGSCKTMDIPGQMNLNLAVNDKTAKVSFIDQIISADNAAVSLFAKDYTLSSSWTIFGLNSMGEYLLHNWDTVSECGCFKQCGRDCKGLDCHDNSQTASPPFICNDNSKRDSYCWSLISSGSTSYTSYNLTHIATVALTSYGGPDANFVSPGFTISNRIGNQNSALNALIMDFNPRQKVNLAASYRYAESEGRVITTQQFNEINNARPTITADLASASCNSTSIHLPLFLTHKKIEEKVSPFHVYKILRKAEIPKLNILTGKHILAPSGVFEWKNQKTFDIFDPCNQQFFTLKITPEGNYFVGIPPFQTLAVSDTICIAISDLTDSLYDLVLYELVINTSVWFASDRFVGLLSKDYLEDLTLRAATKADKILIPFPLTVKVDFHANIEIPYVAFTTSRATTCHVYLSPQCEFDITTTSQMLYAKYPMNNCGPFYEKAGYNCQGVMGYFYPSPIFVKTPLSHYTENTTYLKAYNEDFSASQASSDHQGFLSLILNYFTGWTLQNTPTKLLPILVFVSFIFLIIYLATKRDKQAYEEIDKDETDDSTL